MTTVVRQTCHGCDGQIWTFSVFILNGIIVIGFAGKSLGSIIVASSNNFY
jgi:hypothetical protein